MLCHRGEFGSAGGRFMGRGCHAAGSGRAKVDWLPANNKTTTQPPGPASFLFHAS